MIAVHIAAITEAMGFCECLGIDVALMYDIVSNAAGNSRMFEECFRGMGKKAWRVDGLEEAGEVVRRLVCVIPFSLSFPVCGLGNKGKGGGFRGYEWITDSCGVGESCK